MGIAVGMKDIVQDIVSSYDTRVAEVKGLKKEANEMLASFQASHQKMGAQLRQDLAQDKAKMAAEVKAMQKGFQTAHKKMSVELNKELKGFHSSGEQMGTQLRQELADYVQGIKSEVAGMRQETEADLQKARTTWQGLAHTMEAKRVGVKVAPKVEIPDLEAKLLAAIKEQPKGISLAEVAQSLGVVPVVLGRASRRLLEKGEIRKEDKFYFPLAGE